MRVRTAAAAQDGWAMIVVLGALLIGSMMTIAAFAATDQDQPVSRADQDTKQAYAAAEAGIHDYLSHLNHDNAYWAKCTGVPMPNAVNQAWSGSGADPRRWRQLRNSVSEYTLELLPANGATSCSSANPDGTMINSREGTFRIRSSNCRCASPASCSAFLTCSRASSSRFCASATRP